MKSTETVALQPGRFITKKFLQAALLTVSLTLFLPCLSVGNTIKVLDSLDDVPLGKVGWDTSVAISKDGYPVISYATRTPIPYPNGLIYLRVDFCHDTACTSHTIQDVDSSVKAVEMTSIAIGSDNLPVISYRDRNTGLKVAKCGSLDSNAVCSSWTITQIPSSGQGLYSSIAVDKNNLPVISYQTLSSLQVLKCGNEKCTSGNVDTLLKNYPNPGYTAIALDDNDIPVIAHIWYQLDIVKCGNISCTADNSFILDVDTGMTGLEVDIAIDVDNIPVISYYDEQNGDMKVAKCADTACSSVTKKAVDENGIVGRNTSIAIGSDGFPVISYYAGTWTDLRVAKCSNKDCSEATINTVDSAGDVGWFTSIAIGTNGFPVISYYTETNGDLRLALCSDEACTSAADTTAPVVTAFSIPSTSTSLTVPITTLAATDAVGITGYMLTESSTKPSAGVPGWFGTKPTNYTFNSAGSKTLYAWATDPSGNVSDSMSASVVITDTTAPVVTAFSVPATSSSLTVSITTFTATDAVGVTGYLLTEASAKPAADEAGWSGTKPGNYTFGSAGSKILYAWAKDAAGNVSDGMSASVMITLPPPAAFIVTEPAAGASVPTGSACTVTWTAQTGAASYKVKLSIDGGATWPTTLGTGLSTTTASWNVPTNIKKNITNAMIKVIAYNSNNIKLGVAKSGTFSIDVLTITKPAAADVVPQNASYTITWTANGTAATPDQVIVKYSLNNGSTWKTAAGTLGASSFSWNVPAVTKPKNNAKVKVVLKVAGVTVANAVSSTFTVQ